MLIDLTQEERDILRVCLSAQTAQLVFSKKLTGASAESMNAVFDKFEALDKKLMGATR